jgi:hypothetical protein
MMGYLTAVEEYCHHREKTPFEMPAMLEAAASLEPTVERVTRRIIESGFTLSFDEAAQPE